MDSSPQWEADKAISRVVQRQTTIGLCDHQPITAVHAYIMCQHHVHGCMLLWPAKEPYSDPTSALSCCYYAVICSKRWLCDWELWIEAICSERKNCNMHVDIRGIKERKGVVHSTCYISLLIIGSNGKRGLRSERNAMWILFLTKADWLTVQIPFVLLNLNFDCLHPSLAFGLADVKMKMLLEKVAVTYNSIHRDIKKYMLFLKVLLLLSLLIALISLA